MFTWAQSLKWISAVPMTERGPTGIMTRTSEQSLIDERCSPLMGAHASVRRTMWLMDTGSGHDLVPQHLVASSSLSVTPPDTAVSLSTANGPTAVESVAQIRVDALDSISEALVLPSTPLVLSVGRRCMEDGFSFVWKAKQAPYLISPSGTVTALSVDGYTPYLVDGTAEQLVLPALEAAEPDALPVDAPVEANGGKRGLKRMAITLPHLLTHFPGEKNVV